MGIVLEFFRARQHRFIALDHFPCNRGVHIFDSFHRLHRTEAGALIKAGAHIGEVDKNNVTELINSKSTDANANELTIEMGVFVAVGKAVGGGELERHQTGGGELDDLSLREIDQSRRIECGEGFRQGQLDVSAVGTALNKQIEGLSQRSIGGKFAR